MAPEVQVEMAGIRRRIWIAATFLALTMGAVAEVPVPPSLLEAVKMTLANNPMHKAALADTKATLAGVSEARAPMLPRIMFAENFTAVLIERPRTALGAATGID